MSSKKLLLIIFITACFCLFSGCSSPTEKNESTNTSEVVLNESEMFTDRDKNADYDESASIAIVLSDRAIECDSSDVLIDGNTVTLSAAGTYLISGSLSDGQIKIEAAKTDKIQLVLNGVSVNSASAAALYVKQADKVFVTLIDDTQNALTNGGSFVAIDENNIDAAIFSKEDITFNGSGALTVSTSYGHGVVSKDDLTITGGAYYIDAAKHALNGKDCVKIADGEFVLNAGTDGIHSENADDETLGYTYIADGTFDIQAASDGIDSSNILQIASGTFNVKCSGKAVKATGNLIVSDGTFGLTSTDDCVHSNANITIASGTFTLRK